MKRLLFLISNLLFTIILLAQTKDTADKRFHEELLDKLVGNWHDTSIAHSSPFTSVVDAK